MEPFNIIINESEPSLLRYRGREVVSFEQYKGLKQYSFSTPQDVGDALKKVVAFLDEVSKKEGLAGAIEKAEAKDNLKSQSIHVEKDNLGNPSYIDSLCEDDGALSVRFSTAHFGVDVESVLCQPGYLPMKKAGKDKTRVRIRTEKDIARYLPILLIDLRAGNITTRTRYHLEKMLKELENGYRKNPE